LLGTGGVAEVWLAEDQRLGRWVAIKLLRESFSAATDKQTVEAFRREATVVARFQHPNIVAVLDAGSHEGRQFIVMEYVHGYSLRQLLETQGRLTETEAVRYGGQVAAALHYAHGQGLVHCDIKPENILINESGTAKVADFGVAESLTRTMTPDQAQDVMGTIAYLAPEVIEGSAPSASSDIYSLALTVFELVAGRPPFAGATAGAALGQRLATPPPPLRAYSRGASTELEAVLARALSLSPADRYPTAAAFGAALQRVPQSATATRTPVAAPPGRPPQLHGRHDTARIRAVRSGRATSGAGAGTILIAVGLVLAALGLGVAAALFIANRDESGGAGNSTPTPSPTAARSPSVPATTTRQPTSAPSPATAAPTDTVAPTQQATPPTPTRTPVPSPSPPTATPSVAAVTPTKTPGP
jgi:serine/threonine-protein kinase